MGKVSICLIEGWHGFLSSLLEYLYMDVRGWFWGAQMWVHRGAFGGRGVVVDSAVRLPC